MKIFQIGFNRCGTRSLAALFRESGVRSVHWDYGRLARRIQWNHQHGRALLQGYENYAFYADMEDAPNLYAHIEYYKILDQQYPNSRFILNVRNKNRWLLSRLRHGDYCERHMLASGLSLSQVMDLWATQWDQHVKDVIKYFRNRETLLVFNIERDDVALLVSFLPEFNLRREYWWNRSRRRKAIRCPQDGCAPENRSHSLAQVRQKVPAQDIKVA
jgi:hypothetical protein